MNDIKREKKSLIDTTNINEKIYQLLKNRILYREYPPGYKLSIRVLQDEFGVSNSPIKDALFKLAGEEFVEITSRKGTFVSAITKRDIWEIEQARIIIESGAAEIVAQHITDEELTYLKILYQDTLMRAEKFDYIRFMEKDFKFHVAIIRLTKNNKLIQMYERLNAHSKIGRFQVARNIKKRLPWTNSDHREILQSFRERNPQKARNMVTQHRIKARDVFLKGAKQI